MMMFSILALGTALAAEPTEPDTTPSFGADVSVGIGAGSLLGSWPDTGVHGFGLGRYTAFARDREAQGPRIGASLWGSKAVWPLQTATEEGLDGPETAPFSYVHYGINAVVRHDPAAPISATAGFGFGRLDLIDYWDGPHVLPTLTFEAGARHRLPSWAFIDWMVRAHWATARAPTGGSLHEWWMVQLALTTGLHMR